VNQKQHKWLQKEIREMKLGKILGICGIAAALCLGASTLLAQDNSNSNSNGGETQGRRGGGGFDPAQFQQRMLDNVRDQLAFTNDTDWAAVQPLVQKVFDARRDVGFAGLGMMRRAARGGGDNAQGGRRGGFGQQGPEAEALQKALDDNAPAAQVKALLEKYRTAHKDKEAKLAQAQDDLRKVLTSRQEAQATLLGLLN
jgi:Spy/CpxP family protein refolding chaperone